MAKKITITTHRAQTEADRTYWRQRTPEERLRMASSMHQTARTIALASMPPDADPSETRRLLFHRFYPFFKLLALKRAIPVTVVVFRKRFTSIELAGEQAFCQGGVGHHANILRTAEL